MLVFLKINVYVIASMLLCGFQAIPFAIYFDVNERKGCVNIARKNF